MALTSAAARARLVFHPEVAAALHVRKPVVALESTIITHGMARPRNLELARAVEEQVRAAGAVPATTALLDGRPHIGLTETQLERLAESRDAVKASRRDMAHVLASRGIGGTTVSGTMILADLANIRIFATGGIGGVHRGGETSMDVSADLTELGRTPVAVFCSGAKSILDIPRTLEYLETQGVSVCSFGAEFPAFYSARSGQVVPRVSSVQEAARMIQASSSLGLRSGMIFGVPIPDSYEAAGARIQEAVEQAVEEAARAGIDKRGKEVTPWLLKRVSELTTEAADSNSALIKNNATVAARTAVELAQLDVEKAELAKEQGQKVYASAETPLTASSPAEQRPAASLLIVGLAAVDISARGSSSYNAGSATTYPGRVSLSLGGVARNMAEAAHRLLPAHRAPLLIAPRRDDSMGTVLARGMSGAGMRTDGLFDPALDLSQDSTERTGTAVCNLLLDGKSGDLITGVADMSIGESVSPAHVLDELAARKPKVVAFDANIPAHTMRAVLEAAPSMDFSTFFEPTSLSKSARILTALSGIGSSSENVRPTVDLCTPNALEAEHLYALALEEGLVDPYTPTKGDGIASLHAEAASLGIEENLLVAARGLAPLFRTLFIKLGSQGVLLMTRARSQAQAPDFASTSHVHFRRFPGLRAPTVHSTTGCGDTFAGALLAGLEDVLDSRTASTSTSTSGKMASMSAPASEEELERMVDLAQRAAVMTLESELAVSPELDRLRIGYQRS